MKCPICRRPAAWEDNPFRPFCSERCKLLDFGAWVNEEYGVPAEETAPSLEGGETPPGEAGEGPEARGEYRDR
ncbi:MAG TPA: DNA gyrase inhibitor YacG [Pyrinomonadaceae bacterium]|nr:DNA gyrase inhibitor YacG [Pyrinomonadaceae bacterium]